MDIFILLIGFGVVIYICYTLLEKAQNQLSETIRLYSQTMTDCTNAMKDNSAILIEQVTRLEQKHWEQLEKQSTKQLQILEKQTKDFMGVMKDFIESSKPVAPVLPMPDLLDNMPKNENTIEKEEIIEPNLQDIPRIPITEGVNVQFEGQDESFPIDIS